MASVTSLKADLGEYLREQRHGAKLSLRQLADLAGVSNPYLSQIERGLKKPSAEILQQLAKGLRISAESLYVRAGILDEQDDRQAGTRAAILADPLLVERQKRVLLDIYAAFCAENDRAAAPAVPDPDPSADPDADPSAVPDADRDAVPDADHEAGPAADRADPGASVGTPDRTPASSTRAARTTARKTARTTRRTTPKGSSCTLSTTSAVPPPPPCTPWSASPTWRLRRPARPRSAPPRPGRRPAPTSTPPPCRPGCCSCRASPSARPSPPSRRAWRPPGAPRSATTSSPSADAASSSGCVSSAPRRT